MSVLARIRNGFVNIFYTVLGIVGLLLVLLISVLLTPVFLYRYVLTKFIAPCFQPGIGKAVTVMGHGHATEFVPQSSNQKQRNVRCAIVVNSYVAGTIKYQEAKQAIVNGWLTAKPGESSLKYPEFQQYPEQWMGYMFWKPDPMFSLQNHLFQHRIAENATKQECENILCNLVESLVNKPFIPKRSPWELHLLQNYKDTNLCSDSGSGDGNKVTVIVARFHHSLVDGFSIMYAIVEGLLGQKLSNIGIPSPRVIERNNGRILKNVWTCLVYKPWRILWDAGYALTFSWHFGGSNITPWTCPNEKKQWFQIYSRTELIPVDKLKFIKNQLGVGFTTVLLSCIGAGAAGNLRRKGWSGNTKIPFLSPVPLPGHPDKLRNHVVAAFFALNANPKFSTLERLKDTERRFNDARYKSQIPMVLSGIGKLVACLPTPLAKYLCANTLIAAGLSNFPGPEINLDFNKKKILSLDFSAGALNGVAGVAFTAVSYNNGIRIGVTAEEAVMETTELAEMIAVIEKEIETLYEYAVAVGKHGELNLALKNLITSKADHNV